MSAKASMPIAPTGRDVLAGLLWAVVPLGFVAIIDAVGIPYEPLPGQPEKDASYALLMYAVIAAGGLIGSLFGLGTALIPGQFLSGEDFRMLGLALTQKASADEVAAYGRGRLVRAALAVVALAVVVGLAVAVGAIVFVPVLATVGFALLFSLSMFAATCQRAARRGLDATDWLVPDPESAKGEDALDLISRPRERSFSLFVWKNRLAWFLGFAVVFTVADQGSKIWAQQNLAVLGDWTRPVAKGETPIKERGFRARRSLEVHIIPQAFSFKYAENPAAAFSLTGSLPEWIRRPFLVGVSTLAMLFIGLWFFLQRRPDGLLMTAFALIIAGALGNLVDRIRFGYVIDFINVYAGFYNPRWIWPTFNIADSCIVVGALTVVYRTLRPLYPEFLDDDGAGSPDLGAGDDEQAPAAPAEGGA